MHGLLNLHKPAGVTSREVVNQIQRLVRPAKVGHAGTLDPLATGVLIVCVGAATRLIEYVQRMPKTYDATFMLGRRSDTDDVEGAVVEIPNAPQPLRADLEKILPRFIGTVSQRPPDYSAVKVSGQRAYDIARRGESLSLPERTISVYSLQIVRYEYPLLQMIVECGSGTYIRSLGRDLGESLGSGAVMSQLVRSKIGPFQIANAIEPDSVSPANLPAWLLPLESAVQELPAIQLTEEEIRFLRRGQAIVRPNHQLSSDAAAFDDRKKLLAVVIPQDADRLRPEKVMPGP